MHCDYSALSRVINTNRCGSLDRMCCHDKWCMFWNVCKNMKKKKQQMFFLRDANNKKISRAEIEFD